MTAGACARSCSTSSRTRSSSRRKARSCCGSRQSGLPADGGLGTYAIAVEVSDTGIGIDAEGMAASVRVVQPGRRLDHTPVRRHRARASRSADGSPRRWAARSRAESAGPGEGATFKLTIVADAAPDLEQRPGRRRAAGRARRAACADRRRPRHEPAHPRRAGGAVGHDRQRRGQPAGGSRARAAGSRVRRGAARLPDARPRRRLARAGDARGTARSPDPRHPAFVLGLARPRRHPATASKR